MTSLPAAPVQALARLLLADEAGGVRASADAAERAFEKLRLHLSKVLGPEGFRVLVRRAVTLAQAEFPWLRSVEVRSDGSLTGLSAAAAARADGSAAEADGGIVAILAHFLGLLEAFLGPDLTRRLVHSVRPEADALPPAGTDPVGASTSNTSSGKNETHYRPDETTGRGTR